MNKIYLQGNYIIIVLDGDTKLYTYPQNACYYSERSGSSFSITNNVDKKSKEILFTDLGADGKWENDSEVKWEEAALRDFLLANTANFKTASGGSGAIGATLLKTGQTVIYRTGDDGDNQEGREVDFFTLENANPFGSTSRFTDELGGSAYTNNIVIDWSTYDNVGGTVLGYYRTLLSSATWANQIDACLALSIGTFTTGWRLVNQNEFSNIYSMTDNVFSGRFDGLNYAPFSISIGNYIWTSTSRDASFAVAHLLNPFGSFAVVLQNKGNSYQAIACRTFTVSGTTLT